MIVRGHIGPEELTPEVLRDPDILRISQAVRLIDDPELTARSVEKRWAEVALVLRDGRRVIDEPRTPRGDADLSLSDAEIHQKFDLLTDQILDRDRGRALKAQCADFDTMDPDAFRGMIDNCCLPTEKTGQHNGLAS